MAKAVRSDSISIPTPGELFAALEKPGKPNWVGQMRGPIGTNYKNRAQIALNLGGLIADGFLIVECQKSNLVEDLGRVLLRQARSLGVGDRVMRHSASLTELGKRGDWTAMRKESVATISNASGSNGLATAVGTGTSTISATLNGISGSTVLTVSAAVLQNYDERAARVLRQPALVNFMQSKLSEVSPDLRDEPLVKEVSGQLPGIEKLVTFPAGKAPTADEVKKVNEAVGKIMSQIQAKETK